MKEVFKEIEEWTKLYSNGEFEAQNRGEQNKVYRTRHRQNTWVTLDNRQHRDNEMVFHMKNPGRQQEKWVKYEEEEEVV